MTLSLIGTRFPAEQLSLPGRLLFVTLDLPEGSVDAVVSIVTCDRPGAEGKAKWLLGVAIYQMNEGDTARLATYLDKRAQGGAYVVPE